jgi:6-pyruvoyltetrahydropterin/6-carboxytetrahydropterin synthase
MFSVGVTDHVMIAHSFADPHFGPAQRLHGATLVVDLEIRARALNSHNVVMDIGALRKMLREICDALDYRNLDEHPAFPGRTSTTERIAEHIADEVSQKMRALPNDARPVDGAMLRVLLRESPAAYASFERQLA